MIQFFAPMIPPKTTAQMHKVTVRNGKPVFYDPPQVKEMKAKLQAAVAPYRPEKPLDGPLQLVVKWTWPGQSYRYKPTKPDTDNLQKALKDMLGCVGFWHDDAQIASEICEKFYGPVPGIYIKIEVLTW